MNRKRNKRLGVLSDLLLVVGMLLIPAGIALGGLVPLAVTAAGAELVAAAVLAANAAAGDDKEGCG